MGKKSPKGGYQTNEQRNYQLKIKEMRSKYKGPLTDGNESDSKGETQGIDKTRQPTLVGLSSDYDLKLFLEAQAAASEKIVSFSFVLIKLLLYYLKYEIIINILSLGKGSKGIRV